MDNTDGKRVWAGRETKRDKQKTAATAKRDLKRDRQGYRARGQEDRDHIIGLQESVYRN